jgi:opacity protein-like surface antigen
MRRISLILIVLLVQGLSGAVLVAGDFGFEVGGFGGYAIWRDRNFTIGSPQVPYPTTIDLTYSYANKPVYGGRFNILSRGHWGGEFTYGYQKNTLTISRPDIPTAITLDGSVQQFFYSELFYLLNYDEHKVVPYVLGSIGLEAYGLSSSALADAANPDKYNLGNLNSPDVRFAFNYGFGVKAKVSPKIGVRFDFRQNFSDVPSFCIPKESTNPAQTVLPIQGKLQNFEFTAGIYYHFSKKLQ